MRPYCSIPRATMSWTLESSDTSTCTARPPTSSAMCLHDIADDHAGALGGQRAAVPGPKAAAPAGDDRNLAFEHRRWAPSRHAPVYLRPQVSGADGGRCVGSGSPAEQLGARFRQFAAVRRIAATVIDHRLGQPLADVSLAWDASRAELILDMRVSTVER